MCADGREAAKNNPALSNATGSECRVRAAGLRATRFDGDHQREDGAAVQLSGKERYSAVLDMIMHAIEAQSCALYLQYNDLMQLCVGNSIDTYAHATVLRLDEPLISRVVQLRRVCTVRDSLAEEKVLS